jgi:hypothetical protein
MVRVVAEQGFESVTVADVVERASGSRDRDHPRQLER